MCATHAHDDPATERDHRGAEPFANQRRWFHVMFSTYGAWLRGDERGFRDHNHRIHSSGDYVNPPPTAEHAGLRRWVKRVMRRPAVSLSTGQRRAAGMSIIQVLQKMEAEPLVIAVSAQHVHMLGKFDPSGVRAVVGEAKRLSAFALRDHVAGGVWAKKCRPKPIRDHAHQVATFNYIRDHIHEGAWVWTFREGELERHDEH